MGLFDTAGEEDFDRLRPLSCSDTNVVLICFCVNHPASLSNVIYKWIPEVRHFCGRCPVMLVACKIDLRDDLQTIERLNKQDEQMITSDMAKQVAVEIKADAYLECSAKTCEGVQTIFVQAARLALENTSRRKKRLKCALY